MNVKILWHWTWLKLGSNSICFSLSLQLSFVYFHLLCWWKRESHRQRIDDSCFVEIYRLVLFLISSWMYIPKWKRPIFFGYHLNSLSLALSPSSSSGLSFSLSRIVCLACVRLFLIVSSSRSIEVLARSERDRERVEMRVCMQRKERII